MNGVTGLKPTWGRVSRAGVFALAPSMDHVGPIARSADDAAALLGALAGADVDDPTAAHDVVPDYLGSIDPGVRGLRIGIDRALIAEGVDADMAQAAGEAAIVLGAAGAVVRDITLPSPDDVTRNAILQCGLEAAVVHAETFPSRAAGYGPVLSGLLETGRALDQAAMMRIVLSRQAFRVQLDALFRDIDLLIMPASNTAAPTLVDMSPARRTPEAIQARLRITAPFDMSGNPALTLPGGKTAAGLPVAFQIIGRHMEEGLVLRAGHAFQQSTDWHRRHPPLD
jgi:amidase